VQLNSALLAQFHQHGISINEGIAIDARLIKSASKLVSTEKLNKLREKQNVSDSQLDKNGKPKKFSRDIESDWTVKNDEPHFCLKEHAAVNAENGLILSTAITPASYHDSTYLPYATICSIHTDEQMR